MLLTKENQPEYFDMIIDEYINNNFEFVENLIINLRTADQKRLLYFLYINQDKYKNPGLYSFILDAIF